VYQNVDVVWSGLRRLERGHTLGENCDVQLPQEHQNPTFNFRDPLQARTVFGSGDPFPGAGRALIITRGGRKPADCLGQQVDLGLNLVCSSHPTHVGGGLVEDIQFLSCFL